MILTIDTEVLATADRERGTDALLVLALLSEIEQAGHYVAMDQGRVIWDEYERNLGEEGEIWHWVTRMSNGRGEGGCRIYWMSKSSVGDAHVCELCCRRGFDKDDLVFVGVAYRTSSKILVAHESDYSDEVCEYLKESDLEVMVKCAVEAKADCQAGREPD